MIEIPESMFGWAESVMRELAYRRGFEVGLLVGIMIGVIVTSIVGAMLLRWTAICLTPLEKREEKS